MALDSTGNMQASVLYGPYGAVRYASGTMPGSYGYTGQQADTTTGLDYDNARYYDASAGQFASADTAADGLNRYGYVHGNPTTLTDPSGHGAGQYYCPHSRLHRPRRRPLGHQNRRLLATPVAATEPVTAPGARR